MKIILNEIKDCCTSMEVDFNHIERGREEEEGGLLIR